MRPFALHLTGLGGKQTVRASTANLQLGRSSENPMTKSKTVSLKAKGGGIKISGFANATVFWPLQDDHPCYRLVGLIAAEGARIEHLLNQAIANAADADLKVAACLTGQMIGPAPRFNALHLLCLERGLSAQLLKRIKTVAGHAGTAFDLRNRAVHDPWMEEVGSGTTHQFVGKPKHKPDFGVKPKSEKQLSDDLAALRKHREEVLELVSDIWNALRTP